MIEKTTCLPDRKSVSRGIGQWYSARDLVRKAFRYRLYPTAEQALRLRAWEDALRFLWNLALEQRRIGLDRRDRRYYTAFDQIGERTELRAELPWLADVPRNVCAQLLVELDKAWQRCFQKLACAPRFKRKHRDVLGLCEPHPKVWRLAGQKIRFPKIGELRAVLHRPLHGTPKTCTVRREGDQWFASIACEIDTSEPPARSEPVVALDRGIVNRIADSDGVLVQSPAFGERMARRLARAQRTVSRRKKGSKNREKAKRCVARLHRKVARQRDQFAHTLSAAYAKSHGTVVVEKLQIQNMVRAHRGLARRILDSTWGRLLECLRYKLEWSGGQLVEVPAHSSSQTCHRCATVDARSRRSQAQFCCTGCGLQMHADLNAALVLKSRANRSALPVEGVALQAPRRSRKRLNVPRRSAESSALSGRG
jgi:putative transposase